MLLSGSAVRVPGQNNGGGYPKLKDIVNNCSDWAFVKTLLGGNVHQVYKHMCELVESDLVCDQNTEHWAALENHIERFPSSFDFQNMKRYSIFTGCVCKITRNLLHLRRRRLELKSHLKNAAPKKSPEIAAAGEKGNEKSKHELEALSSGTLKKVPHAVGRRHGGISSLRLGSGGRRPTRRGGDRAMERDQSEEHHEDAGC